MNTNKLTENDHLFIKGYITCALWSSTNDNGDPLDGDPLDGDPLDGDPDNHLSTKTSKQMAVDCIAFLEKTREYIGNEPINFVITSRADKYGRAGHDFWLTRNGHGAGFWDGDWPKNGDILTKIAEEFCEFTLHQCGDKSIYHI